jgi:hypothetical protein
MPFTPDQPTSQVTPGFVPDSAPGSTAEQQANAMEQASDAQEQQHGGLTNKILTGVEAGSGPIGAELETADPDKLSPILNRLGPVGKVLGAAKTILGKVNPEDIRAREETNPMSAMTGKVAGLLVPGGEGAVLQDIGSKLVPQVAERGILKGMTRGAIRMAAENALYQSGDETTKMILNDPNQTVGTAITNIGLAGLLGAGAGAAIGSVSPLWKAASETKVGEFVNDFKTRMQEHLGTSLEKSPEIQPEPISSNETKVQPKLNLDPMKASEPLFPKDYNPQPEQPIPGIAKAEPIVSKPIEATSGGKAADTFVKHADEYVTHGLGGAIGGFIGHLSGIPMGGAIGALLGERTLSPFFKSILPSIAKSILEKSSNAEGLKAATDYGLNVIKGEKLANAAVKNTFNSSPILPDSKQPTAEQRQKLDTHIAAYSIDPEKLANVGGSVGHYMPQHQVAMGQVASNAVNFLNSIRPQEKQSAPLDPKLKPSQAVQAQYDRVLDIAQQPLLVIKSIKDGTLTSHDVTALHTLYPDLYKGLRSKIMEQMVETVSKGEIIPYDTRLGLSMFLQQPLDSTMKPMAIAAAQPLPQQPQMGSSSGQNNPKGPKKVSQAASSNLIKGAKSSQTASQASESMHSTDKA